MFQCYAVVKLGRKWHSRGQRFDPAILHHEKGRPNGRPFFVGGGWLSDLIAHAQHGAATAACRLC